MNTHYGFDTEYMSLIEAAWESEEKPSSDPSASGPKLAEKKLSNGNLKTIDDESLLDFEKPLTAETIRPITLHRLQKIRDVLVKNVGYEPEQVSLRDAAIVRWACAIVVQRAARLSGCAVATVIKQMGLEHRLKDELEQGGGWISVGVDGRYALSIFILFIFNYVGAYRRPLDSLIQHYPRFEERMRHSLRMLIGEDLESKVEIGLAKDGSGVGGKRSAVLFSIRHQRTKSSLQYHSRVVCARRHQGSPRLEEGAQLMIFISISRKIVGRKYICIRSKRRRRRFHRTMLLYCNTTVEPSVIQPLVTPLNHPLTPPFSTFAAHFFHHSYSPVSRYCCFRRCRGHCCFIHIFV